MLLPLKLIPLIIGGIVALITAGATITVSAIKKEMRKKGISGCIVDLINRCDNTIKLNDLDSNVTFKMKGESISDELYEGECIYV